VLRGCTAFAKNMSLFVVSVPVYYCDISIFLKSKFALLHVFKARNQLRNNDVIVTLLYCAVCNEIRMPTLPTMFIDVRDTILCNGTVTVCLSHSSAAAAFMNGFCCRSGRPGISIDHSGRWASQHNSEFTRVTVIVRDVGVTLELPAPTFQQHDN